MVRSIIIWSLLIATSVVAQDVSIQPVPSSAPAETPSSEPTPPISAEPAPTPSSEASPPVVTPSDEPSQPSTAPSEIPSAVVSSAPPDAPTDSAVIDSSAGGSAAPTASDVVTDSVSGSTVSAAASSTASVSGSAASDASVDGSSNTPAAVATTMSTINPEATALTTVTASTAQSGSVVQPDIAPSSSASDSQSEVAAGASSASGVTAGGASSLPVSASETIDGTASVAATLSNLVPASAATDTVDGPPDTRTPIINVEATDSASGTSTINSASTSIPTTPVIAATSRSYPLDQGDDNFVVGKDETNLPERFISDEIVTTLTYTANYDKNLCETKAQQYSTRASQSLLSHWSFLMHRRQNSASTSICLPALYEIPTTVHWVIPSGANRDKWVNWDAWNYQITQTRNQLQQLNVALSLSDFRFYQGTDSDRMTNRPKAPENLDFAKGWVSAAKAASQSTAYNHLNIFIVENPNDDTLGYSNYPGATAESYYPDAVIIGAASLPGNTELFDQAHVGDQDGREGTTLAHEIGHWLGLLHLHEGGCDGTDGIATTPQYASGSDYSKTCLGEDKGPDGIYEHNMMSFAAGRTVKSAFFNQEQMVRAAVGYLLRRNGLSSSTIEEQWLKLCPESARNVTRRSLPLYDTSSHLPLTRRQMSNELSQYCQKGDLTVSDYTYSSLGSVGLFNPNSPTIPSSPGIVLPETVNIGAVTTGAGERAGSNFGDLDDRVNAQIAQSGSITSNDTTPIDSPEPPRRNGAEHMSSLSRWVMLSALAASAWLL